MKRVAALLMLILAGQGFAGGSQWAETTTLDFSVAAATLTTPATTIQTVANGTQLAPYRTVSCLARLTGLTGGTLDVYLQTSYDGGTTWVDMVHFTQLAAAASLISYEATVQRGVVAAAIGSAVNNVDGTPVLAAGNTNPGSLGNAVRAVYVAGASTSAQPTAEVLKCYFSS